MNNDELIIEKTYHASVDRVWKAITDQEHMKQWYFDIPDFKPELHHEFNWWGGPPGDKQWHHRGRIEELVEGKKLAHTWWYPGHEGKALVIWELTALDAGTTKVVLTFRVLTPFDPNENALRWENFATGWDHIINTGLKEYAENK